MTSNSKVCSGATGKKAIRKTRGKVVSNRIKIVTGKIECTVADAIVNAANSVHIGGGGIDGAIHRAAGPQLAKVCSEFERNERGEWCPTGEARTTPAFDIKSAKYIIHTAGPDCRGGYCEEWHGSELACCYRSVLKEAVKHGCKTVAIPSISTGIFGFPLEDAAHIAMATVAEFLKKHAEIEVTFVLWDGDGKGDAACALYRKTLAEYTALSFSKKELDEFRWLFYHGEKECPMRSCPFDMLWTVERHIKTHMRIGEVKKHYIESYAHVPRCIFEADASPTVKALVFMIYIGCDTFAPADGIAKIYFRQSLKMSDLRFRFYAGEDRCPERFVKENEKRWWHQESTVKGEQAVQDFAERAMSDWPCVVMCSTNDDGERAVALSGYLNTKKHWGEDVAGDFDGYFEYPVNDYRLDVCQKEKV